MVTLFIPLYVYVALKLVFPIANKCQWKCTVMLKIQ